MRQVAYSTTQYLISVISDILPWTCGSDQGRDKSLNEVWLYTGRRRASAELETETLSVAEKPRQTQYTSNSQTITSGFIWNLPSSKTSVGQAMSPNSTPIKCGKQVWVYYTG